MKTQAPNTALRNENQLSHWLRHLVPSYKIKNECSKKFVLTAVWELEGLWSHLNLLFHTEIPSTTFLIHSQPSGPLFKQVQWPCEVTYPPKGQFLLLDFYFIECKSSSCNIHKTSTAQRNTLVRLSLSLSLSLFLFFYKYLRRTIMMSSLFQAKHPYFFQPFFIQHTFWSLYKTHCSLLNTF